MKLKLASLILVLPLLMGAFCPQTYTQRLQWCGQIAQQVCRGDVAWYAIVYWGAHTGREGQFLWPQTSCNVGCRGGVVVLGAGVCAQEPWLSEGTNGLQ